GIETVARRRGPLLTWRDEPPWTECARAAAPSFRRAVPDRRGAAARPRRTRLLVPAATDARRRPIRGRRPVATRPAAARRLRGPRRFARHRRRRGARRPPDRD